MNVSSFFVFVLLLYFRSLINNELTRSIKLLKYSLQSLSKKPLQFPQLLPLPDNPVQYIVSKMPTLVRVPPKCAGHPFHINFIVRR